MLTHASWVLLTCLDISNNNFVRVTRVAFEMLEGITIVYLAVNMQWYRAPPAPLEECYEGTHVKLLNLLLEDWHEVAGLDSELTDNFTSNPSLYCQLTLPPLVRSGFWNAHVIVVLARSGIKMICSVIVVCFIMMVDRKPGSGIRSWASQLQPEEK